MTALHALRLIADASSVPGAQATAPLIHSNAGVLAALLMVLATIFWLTRHPVAGRFFKVVPALLFCYFVPTALSATGVIPIRSEVYEFVKGIILPGSLLLLTLSLDMHGIVRLGPKAGIMLLAGAFGVVIGGPIALLVCSSFVPDDAWQPMTYLAGSWIGGSANAVAIQRSFGISDTIVSPMIVVDAFMMNCWLAFLLYFAGRHERVDTWLGGDTSAIVDLEARMEQFHAKVRHEPTVADLLMILALAFGGAWAAECIARWMMTVPPFVWWENFVGDFAWKVILVTAVGVALSFTRARNLEGAGASRIGGLMIYLLVACIGAGADFGKLAETGWFLVLGIIWMAVHVTVMLIVARLIRAPFFFVAVASEANIGGAASAPIVAGAFNPVLAPVGALLAIAGYVIGTIGGLVCVWMLRAISG